MELDVTNGLELKEVSKPAAKKKTTEVTQITSQPEFINCLKNEKVVVKHIDKQTGLVKDPKHVLYGGMAETAKKTYVVPLLRSGMFVDVLTKDEKNYLEYVLGLEPNTMSVYKKENNFWSTANPEGVSSVTLTKQDNYFDLSNPTDYIKIKILLANKDRIAPSIEALQNQPKATYEFVIVSESDKSKTATARMNYKKQAYKTLGKIEDDIHTLRFIIETIDGRPVAQSAKLDTLQVKVDDLIQANASLFLKVVNDPLLDTKVLIKKGIEAGVITKRGDYHYMREDNMPLCNNDQEPTLSIAATFLNEPKHQDLKFSIEAKVK